jgi:hypothetical protein
MPFPQDCDPPDAVRLVALAVRTRDAVTKPFHLSSTSSKGIFEKAMAKYEDRLHVQFHNLNAGDVPLTVVRNLPLTGFSSAPVSHKPDAPPCCCAQNTSLRSDAQDDD